MSLKTCKHWRDVGMTMAGYCKLYDKTYRFAVCESCPVNTATGTGWEQILKRARLGDKTQSFGVCADCVSNTSPDLWPPVTNADLKQLGLLVDCPKCPKS
jgi:hypothetical protein